MRSVIAFTLIFSFSGASYAQENVALEVSKQLAESKAKFPGMRPHIFFTQDKYAPGDTAFFRLFILTEDERILAERFLLTLELVSPRGSMVVKQNVSCVTFGAANQLILPQGLAPGQYELRLYSHRMTKAYGLSAALTIVEEKELKPVSPEVTTLSIFPEGGHIIEGALNRLVIRASGKVPVSGALYSAEERIMPVTFDKDGLATLLFIPLANKSYRIEYVSDEVAQAAPVPAPEPDALTIRVYAGPRKMWVLDIPSGPNGPKVANLMLISHRTVFHAQEIRIAEGRASLLVAPDFFPEGFSELFILDQQQNVLAYRPVYRQARGIASVTLNNVPDKASLRELISASIRLTDSTQNPVLGALAISVIHESARIRPLRTPDPSIALHHDQLEIDIARPVDPVQLELMARPMPRFIVPEYPPLVYNSNLNLSGRVYSTDPATPLPYSCKIVIYLHKDLIQYEAPVEGDGKFHFPKIYDFLGADHVFYKVVQQNNRDVPRVRVEWSSNSITEPGNDIQLIPTGQTDTYGDLRKRKHAIDQSYNFFLSTSPSVTDEAVNRNAALEDEFQQADVTIYPREYTPFETMQELILEVIPSLLFRARQKDSLVEVALTTRSPFVAQRYAEGNALYIIDGWMTTDTRYLMSLSPKDIVAVRVINDIGKLDRLGNLARNGVLFVQTSVPEVTRRDLSSKLYVIHGFSPTLFFGERYPSQKRVPDLRSLLFWNPQVSTDSLGSASFTFRTSDIPGTYWVRIMGTTSTGHMIAVEKPIEVNFK